MRDTAGNLAGHLARLGEGFSGGVATRTPNLTFSRSELAPLKLSLVHVWHTECRGAASLAVASVCFANSCVNKPKLPVVADTRHTAAIIIFSPRRLVFAIYNVEARRGRGGPRGDAYQ